MKILQQNCSPRLQAAVGKMSLRSSPKRRRKRGAYHLSGIFSENFLTDGTGHSLPKNEKRSEPFQLSLFANAVIVLVQINVTANARIHWEFIGHLRHWPLF